MAREYRIRPKNEAFILAGGVMVNLEWRPCRLGGSLSISAALVAWGAVAYCTAYQGEISRGTVTVQEMPQHGSSG